MEEKKHKMHPYTIVIMEWMLFNRDDKTEFIDFYKSISKLKNKPVVMSSKGLISIFESNSSEPSPSDQENPEPSSFKTNSEYFRELLRKRRKFIVGQKT